MTPRRPDDAVVWRDRAPELLELIPVHRRRRLAQGFREDVREYRREADDFGVMPEVRAETFGPGLKALRCLGAQAFHVDTEFPRFSHLLILRSRRYMVEGGNWSEPFVADQPGDVICLDTHMFHALRTPDEDGPEDLQEAVVYPTPYPHIWTAISMESWIDLRPAQAQIAFQNALTYDPERLYAKLMGDQL
jgi:hypothetical protein